MALLLRKRSSNYCNMVTDGCSFCSFCSFCLSFPLDKVAGASGKGSYPRKNLVLGVFCFFFGIVRFWISCGFGMEKNSMSTKIGR